MSTLESRWLGVLVLGLMLLGAGCGVQADAQADAQPEANPTALCAVAQQGQRFAVCGQLTTSIGAAQGTAWVIDGSADSRSPKAAGARAQEGTFHAGH